MGKKILYAHAGSGNHGCEAIVRASANLLGNDIVLYSIRPEEDTHYGVDQTVSNILLDQDRVIGKHSLAGIASRIQTKLTGSIDAAIYHRKKSMFDAVAPGDVAFSIGGDNYCYPGTEILAAQNNLFHKKGAKTVLWGCSVEPELLNNPAIAKDLSSYDLITARESISYAALKTVNPNTVLVADPAFLLDRKDLPLPEGWIEGNMIGINASPLILQNGRNSTLVLDAYKVLIQHILDTTDSSVALIPHVVCNNNDDRAPLRILHESFHDTGRVILLEDHNCMELKGYIARCRMFIGARTHATIAAYSSCVPTLVLGYSVKSRGIARDLFGTEENYVIPVQGLQNIQDLARGFDWLKKHETDIRCHLEQFMPTYKNRAYAGIRQLENEVTIL